MAREESISGAILKNYEDARPIYEAYTLKIESLIRELLKDASIEVHSVTSRAKEHHSLDEKLKRRTEKYDALEDITDLSGVRVTCWLLDQITQIEKVIRANFEIDETLSIDKREVLGTDRFGYVSIHYIVSLSKDRKELPEFKRFADLCCEVQVRTILQHAWAEIEHDLGYKSKIEVPNDIKRRFYRLAGLFELADAEFQRLRDDIENYRKQVSKRIELRDENIQIDKVSLLSYIESSKVLQAVDNDIVPFFGEEARLTTPASASVENDLQILRFFNIRTTIELDRQLEEHSKDIVSFAKKWIRRIPEEDDLEIPRGISIFYLGYYFASMTRDRSKISNYLDMFKFRSTAAEMTDRLLEIIDDL